MDASFFIKAAPFLPLVLVATGLPMTLELVPPNRFYGFRTSQTLASPDLWYSANFAAGLAAVLLGLAATAINLLVRRSAAVTPERKVHVILATTILAAIGMAIAGFAAA